MAKKKSVTEAEQIQAAQEPALLPGEAVQEVQTDAPPMPEPVRDESPCQEAPAAEDAPEEDGAEPVCYRVSAPGGLHLRAGPGRAYRSLAVLPAGSRVLTDEAAEMLRADRSPGDSAWMVVLSKAGSGWVDGAYLERTADEPAD